MSLPLSDFFKPVEITSNSQFFELVVPTLTKLGLIRPGAPEALGTGTVFNRDNRVTRSFISLLYQIQFGTEQFNKELKPHGYSAKLPERVLTKEVSLAIDSATKKEDLLARLMNTNMRGGTEITVITGTCSLGRVTLSSEQYNTRIPGGLSVVVDLGMGEQIYIVAHPIGSAGRLYFEHAGSKGCVIAPGKASLKLVADRLVQVFSTLDTDMAYKTKSYLSTAFDGIQ